MTTRSTQAAGNIAQKNTTSGNFIGDCYVVRQGIKTNLGATADFRGDATFRAGLMAKEGATICKELLVDIVFWQPDLVERVL